LAPLDVMGSSSSQYSGISHHSGIASTVTLSQFNNMQKHRKSQPNNTQHQRRFNKDLRCSKCNQIGHAAKDCSAPIVCKWCQRMGHRENDCEEKHHFIQQQQQRQQIYCIRCKTVGHRVQDCTAKREEELHAPQKKQYPREKKEPPDGVEWPIEELRIIKRMAVLAELIADSKLQKARHEKFRDLTEFVHRSVTFRSRLTGIETKISLDPDTSKKQEHHVLVQAWEEEITNLVKEFRNCELIMYDLIEKSKLVDESKFKMMAHSSLPSTINKSIQDVHEQMKVNAAIEAQKRADKFVAWLNFFITEGRTTNKKVIEDEIIRIQIKEANKAAEKNSNAIRAATARGSTAPQPIGLSPRAGSTVVPTSSLNQSVPPITYSAQKSAPPPSTPKSFSASIQRTKAQELSDRAHAICLKQQELHLQQEDLVRQQQELQIMQNQVHQEQVEEAKRKPEDDPNAEGRKSPRQSSE